MLQRLPTERASAPKPGKRVEKYHDGNCEDRNCDPVDSPDGKLVLNGDLLADESLLLAVERLLLDRDGLLLNLQKLMQRRWNLFFVAHQVAGFSFS